MPRSLRLAPRSLLARFLGFVTKTSSSPSTVLCPAHRGLNSRLVRAVFDLLVEEVGGKARPLRRFARHPGRYHLKRDEGRPDEVCALVDRLTDLEGMWHGSVLSGCEACILAIVGGDEDVLRDLWAVVVGRTHKRRNMAPPVFGGLVAAWIENLEDGEKVKREAEALGRTVKRVRWAVSKHRREKRSIRSVSKSKRKARRGRERARDSGYGSATGNGGDLAAWRPADDLGATLVYRSSLSLSRENGRGRYDDMDPYIQTTVEYDVLLRKSDTLSRCQPGTTDPNISTHNIPQDSTTDEQFEEYDVFFRERSTAACHHQQLHASDANSSSSTLHIPPPSIPEEGEDEYDADDDDSDYDEDEPDMWYRTLIKNNDAEFDPIIHATSNSTVNISCSESPRSDPSDEAMNLRPLTLGLVDGLSQSEEPYDPAQWTDVTVATRDTRCGGGGVAEGCGSSSVYSTTGTAIPHPPVLAASTVVTSGGRLRRALTSGDELAWAAWPKPFADAPPITTITHRNAIQRLPRASPSLSNRTVADTAGDSIITAELSPDDFHNTLQELDSLFIVNTAKGHIAGIPEGTVLPWESISAVGRCSCTAQLEIWREGIPCDQ